MRLRGRFCPCASNVWWYVTIFPGRTGSGTNMFTNLTMRVPVALRATFSLPAKDSRNINTMVQVFCLHGVLGNISSGDRNFLDVFSEVLYDENHDISQGYMTGR